MQQRGRKSAASAALSAVAGKSQPGARRLTAPNPPAHLGAPEQVIWRDLFEDFSVSIRISVSILQSALEAHQRAREARESIDDEGMTVEGRDGQLKPHPLLATERDARQAFLSALKMLELEL